MSGLRGRVYATRTITTKILIGITFSLTVVGLICSLLNFPRALAASILADDFNDNSIDTAKWNPNDLFSGFTNTNVPIAETSQRLEIGPLLQNVSGSSYRGMRTVNTYTFSDAYAYVELVQAPASNTSADAMFTVGSSVTAYYRISVNGGVMRGVRNVGGTKTTLFSTTYDSTNHRFWRITNTSTGAVTLDTAPGSSGVPGTWTQQYSEIWSSSIPTTGIYFEVKGGTFQTEANAPGKVIFDNFQAADSTGSTGAQISNINSAVTCNTSVLVNFSTDVASHSFVEYGTSTSYGSSTIDDLYGSARDVAVGSGFYQVYSDGFATRQFLRLAHHLQHPRRQRLYLFARQFYLEPVQHRLLDRGSGCDDRGHRSINQGDPL